MAKNFRRPFQREVPTALKNAAVDSTAVYNDAGEQTSPPLTKIPGFVLNDGDNFSSAYYDYTWRKTAFGMRWVRNAKAGASAGGAMIGGPYAPIESPVLTGTPLVPRIDPTTLLNPVQPGQIVSIGDVALLLKSVLGSQVGLSIVGESPAYFSTLQEAIDAIPTGKTGNIVYAGSNETYVIVNKSCVIHATQLLPSMRIDGANIKVTIYGNLHTTDDSQEATLYYSKADVSLYGDIIHTTTTPSAAIVGFPTGKLLMRGNITLSSTNSQANCYADSPSPSTSTTPTLFDFKGNMFVLNKGSLGSYKGNAYLEGFFFSRDLGIYSLAYVHHIRGIVDLRQSTSATPQAIRLSWGSFDVPITTVHSGSALLCPPGVEIFSNLNKDVLQNIYLSMGATVSKTPTSKDNYKVNYIDIQSVIVKKEDGTNLLLSVDNADQVKFTPLT